LEVRSHTFISETDGGEVVSFMLWQLYRWGENIRYSLDRRLDRPQSQSGRSEILAPAGNRTPVVQTVISHFTD
jgi:hypothetical protein